MRQTLSIKNWDEFQHYKDRNPPWIKLHNTLLEDYDFECLPDASKGHLLCIWMLASRTGNKIPYDQAWVGRKIGASTKVDLEGLLASGFLVLNQALPDEAQDASRTLSECEQDAIPEQSRVETEREAEQPLPSVDAPPRKQVPYEDIREIYNEQLPTLTGSRILSPKAKRNIERIWKKSENHQNREFWNSYFGGISQLSHRMDNWSGVSNGNKSGNIELITREEIFIRSVDDLTDAGIWSS